MDTPHWSWDKILDSVGAGKSSPHYAEAMDRTRPTGRETRQTGLINSILHLDTNG